MEEEIELEKLIPTTTEYSKGAEAVASSIKKEVKLQEIGRDQLAQSGPNPFRQEITQKNSGVIGSGFSDYRREDMFNEYSDGTLVSSYDVFRQGVDNEELKAQQQKSSEKWGNGLTKLAGKFGTGVAGNLVGSFYGLGEAIFTGRSSAIYDNSFMDKLDDMNTYMDNKLPNWYTQKEKDMSAFESMGTANFWANDVTSGATFTLSTIASELALGALTGGTSLATTGARVGANIARQATRATKLMRATAKKASRLNLDDAFLRVAELPPTTMTNIGAKAGELAKNARYMYTSSMYESGFETRMFRNESRANFDNSFLELNGRLPNLEEREEYEKYLDQASQFTFGANMLFVGTSNLIGPMKSIIGFTGSSSAKGVVNKNLFGTALKETKEGTFKALAPTKGQKYARKGYNIFSGIITEGAQEGLQGSTTNASNKWIETKFNPETNKSMYDLLDAFRDGMGETLTTKEGHKEMLIGALIGMFSGGVGAYRQSGSMEGKFKTQDKRNEALQKFSESSLGKNMSDVILYGQRTIRNTGEFEKALSEGDKVKAENLRKESFVNQFTFAHNQDYFDETVEQGVISIKLTEDAEIMEAYGMTLEEAQAFKEERVQEYRDLSREYKKNRRFADQYIGDSLTKEEQEKFKGSTDRLKELVAYTLTMGKDSYNTAKDNYENIIAEVADIYGDGSEDVMRAFQTIDMARTEQQEEFYRLRDELETQQEEIGKLETERNNLTRSIYSKEAELQRTERLNFLTSEIEKGIETKEKIEKELNGVLRIVEASNPFSEGTFSHSYITGESLKDVQEKLDELEKYLKEDNALSESKQGKLLALMENYGKNVQVFKDYADTARQFTNRDLGVKGKGSFVKNWLNKTPISNTTVEFLEGMTALDEAGVITQGASDMAILDSGVVEEVLRRRPGDKPKATFVARTETESQKRIQGLREQISAIVNKSPYLKKLGLTDSEIVSGEAMVLADEILQDTTLTEEGKTSLKELVDQLNLLEAEHIETPQEVGIDEEGFQELITDTPFSYFNETQERVAVRDAEVVQVYESVFVKTGKDTVSIHNITPQGLMESIGQGTVTITKKDGTTEEIPITIINSRRGDIETIQILEGEVTITLNPENGTMSMSKEHFQEMISSSEDMTVYNNAITRTNKYLMLYKGGSPLSTDFNEGEVKQSPQEIYKMKPGTKVYFRVDPSEPFNKQLLDEWKKDKRSKEAKKGLLDNLKIDVIDAQGNNVGTLKGNVNTQNAKDGFLELRKLAYDSATKSKDGQAINLGASTKVKHVFIGLPNLRIVDGRVEMKPVDPEAVEDFGYWDGKKLILRGKTSGVRIELPAKIGKKNMPVVVLRHHGQLIAFPVSLNPVTVDIRAEIESNFFDSENLAQTTLTFNNRLIEAGIDPRRFNLYFSSENDNTIIKDGKISPQLSEAIAELESREGTTDFRKDWMSEDFAKEDLAEVATIGVDERGNFMISPRPVLNFDSIDTTNKPEKVKKQNKVAKKVSSKVAQVVEERKEEEEQKVPQGPKLGMDRQDFDHAKTLPVAQRVPYLVSKGIIKPTTYKSKGKEILIANINGVDVAFYKTGQDASAKNKWQPFFGFGNAGNLEWLVRGNSTQVKEGYDNSWIQEYMGMLNSTLGGTQSTTDSLTEVATELEFNEQLTGKAEMVVEAGSSQAQDFVAKKLKEINKGTTVERQTYEINLSEEEQAEFNKNTAISADKAEQAKEVIEKDC